MIGAIVNDESVPINYELDNKDRIKIVTSQYSMGPNREWLKNIKTTHAKRRIKEFNKK